LVSLYFKFNVVFDQHFNGCRFVDFGRRWFVVIVFVHILSSLKNRDSRGRRMVDFGRVVGNITPFLTGLIVKFSIL